MRISARHKVAFGLTALITSITFLSACGNAPAAQEHSLSGLTCTEEVEFGNICFGISIDDFNADGFEYGDSVCVSFSNGYTLDDLPYYNGYYSRFGEPLLVAYPGYPTIMAAITSGSSMWEAAGVTEGCTADIRLVERGRYMDVQNARDIHYTDNREDYASDEVFANFRTVAAGNIGKGVLCRSASPCDNRHNRAPYTDKLTKEAGVRFILDLADDDEKIKGYMEAGDFDSPYFTELRSAGKVCPLAMSADYGTEEFMSKLKVGLVKMSGNDGPYLVHCTEGKDRTGFVCMLLEALMGASYKEIEADYMKTYENYFHITEASDKAKYDVIVRDLLIPMLNIITGDESVDVRTADLSGYAEKMLIASGMTAEQTDALRQRLRG